MSETEITETETPVEEPVEEIRDPRAVLAKNKQLLSDLKAEKERTAALAELGRTVAGDDAVADPRAFLAKRTADAQAARERERVVREAVLTKIVKERRDVKGDVEDLVARVLADPAVKLDGDKITGLDAALQSAPRKAAPVAPPPWSGQTMQRPAAPKSFEELQSRGTSAVQLFATQSPETYQALKADFDKRLSKGASLR